MIRLCLFTQLTVYVVNLSQFNVYVGFILMIKTTLKRYCICCWIRHEPCWCKQSNKRVLWVTCNICVILLGPVCLFLVYFSNLFCQIYFGYYQIIFHTIYISRNARIRLLSKKKNIRIIYKVNSLLEHA